MARGPSTGSLSGVASVGSDAAAEYRQNYR
jgi:hypothetical protein